MSELRDAVDAAVNKIDDLETQHEADKFEIQRLGLIIADVRIDLERNEKTIQGLESSLAQQEKDLQNREAEILLSRNLGSSKDKDIRAYVTRIRNFEKALQEKADENKNLISELEKQKRKVQAGRVGNLEATNKFKEEFQAMRDAHAAEIQDLKTENKRIQRLLAPLQKEFETVKQELDGVTSDFEAAQIRAKNATDAKKRAMRKTAMLGSEVVTLQEKVQELTEELDKLRVAHAKKLKKIRQAHEKEREAHGRSSRKTGLQLRF